MLTSRLLITSFLLVSFNHANHRLNFVDRAVAQGSPDVKTFGAVGDGQTDDSAAIQAAVNKGGTVTFPAGTYLVTKSITVPSDVTLSIGPSATIKFNGTEYGQFGLVLHSAHDVRITGGGTITGEGTNNPKGIPAGIGILEACDRVSVTNITLSNFPDDNVGDGNAGDGIYIGRPTSDGTVPMEITVKSCKFRNNGRNHVSVTAGEDIKVLNCDMSGSLLDGVDVEPNKATDTCRNVTVRGNTIAGSRTGVGASAFPTDVTVFDNKITVNGDTPPTKKDYNSFAGIDMWCSDSQSSASDNTVHGGYIGICVGKGGIAVRNNRISGARQGVWLRGPGATIDKNEITDCWEYGIRVQANDTTITRNTITDCGDADKLQAAGASEAIAITVVDGYTNGIISKNQIKDTRSHPETRRAMRLPSGDKGGSTWTVDQK